VFVGAVRFSARCLEALAAGGLRFEAVMGPEGPGPNADYEDLAPVAARHGFPFRRFRKISEEASYLQGLAPDIIFVMGLSQLLPPAVLSAARIGVLGSHPALLPQNRGRHPIVWALANGLSRGGLSLFWIDAGVDSGDLWRQAEFPIAPEDDAGTVYEKVCRAAESLLTEGLAELRDGTPARRPQDHSAANVWRKRTPADGRIDWRMSSRRIVDLTRALAAPYPGATAALRGTDVPVGRVEPRPGDRFENFEPGKVVGMGPRGPLVKTGDGVVELVEHGFVPVPEPGEYLL